MKFIRPEVEALLPEGGIAQLKLHCLVCQSVVPASRATQKRYQGTCSPVCGQVMKLLHTHNRNNRYCKQCMHPCTPEEVKLFRQWRASLRPEELRRGRPPVKRVAALEGALREAIAAMAGEEFDELRSRFENIVDKKRPSRSILAPSGNSADFVSTESEEAHHVTV